MNNLEEIEHFAKENYVPIARKETLNYILKTIKDNNYKSFLEIGTAIGYTSIAVYKHQEGMVVTTIEYEPKRYEIAKENFIKFGVDKKINHYLLDARFFFPDLKYDVIFIDAAKKRNKYFVNKFMQALNPKGVIIVDNMNLDDLWEGCNEKKKEKYDKVNDEFKEYFLARKDLDVKVYDDIGDGICVIRVK